MPDLTGLPALDVLIGLVLMFFLLATVVASINEVIQTVLNARARILTRGITTLLNSKTDADKFFEQWQIKRLAKPAGVLRDKLPFLADRRRPSYLPSRAFALALLKANESESTIGNELVAEVQATVDTLGSASLSSAVAGGLSDAQRRIDATRAELERAFDDVMDRASGWYKRYVQWWLLALSLAVAIGMNVNTFTVAERLWKDDALRAVVVKQAQKTVGDGAPLARQTATPKTVAEQIDKIGELKLPIGWAEANTKGDIWGRLAGWLVTAAALALGAPFWFDLLGKLSRVRGSGTPEPTANQPGVARV